METKRCSRCGKDLPLTEFHKRTASPDGLQGYCKSCFRETHLTRRTRLRYIDEKSGEVKPEYTAPELDGKTHREVMDIMVRCKLWLEARGCIIQLSGKYIQEKQLKF